MQEVKHYKQIECKHSEIHGWGVFAAEQISADEIIEVAPGIIAPMEILRMCRFLMMSDGMPANELKIDQYGLEWPNDKVLIPFGWVGLYNHSDDPAAQFESNEELGLIGIKAIRSILPGEEITVSYGAKWWETKDYLMKT